MIHLLGAGAQTAVGHSLKASAAATRAGLGRLVEHPKLVDRSGEPVVVASAPWLDDDLDGAARLIQLGRRALRGALAQAGRRSRRSFEGAPLQVFLALPPPRPGRDPALDTQVATGLGEALEGLGAEVAIEVIPRGHAAGLAAIARAHQAIREGRAEICLAGGIDSYLDPATIAWLDEAHQLRSTENRWGFTPGEAAGFCVLASEAYVARHHLRPLAAILGAGLAEEPHRIKSGTVCTGEGLTRAFRRRARRAARRSESRSPALRPQRRAIPHRRARLHPGPHGPALRRPQRHRRSRRRLGRHRRGDRAAPRRPGHGGRGARACAGPP